jgi:hypothetical protein
VVVSSDGTPTVTAQFSIETEGSSEVSCSATDAFGNESAVSATTVAIDSRLPSLTASVTPPPAPSGWYKISTGAPTVRFVCTDPAPGSGMSAGACPTAARLAEGADQTVSRTVVDVAGDVSAPAVASDLDVDLTAPTVTCPKPAPIFVWKQSGAQVTAAVSDATSGPVAASIQGGADTSAVGKRSVKLVGSDRAGNRKTASCTYLVAFGFGGFSSPSEGSSWPKGHPVPVSFGLTDASGSPVSDAVAQALAGAGKAKVQLRSGSAVKVTRRCGYVANDNRFSCSVVLPSTLSQGYTASQPWRGSAPGSRSLRSSKRRRRRTRSLSASGDRSFYASVEQRDDPALRGRAVIVVGGVVLAAGRR